MAVYCHRGSSDADRRCGSRRRARHRFSRKGGGRLLSIALPVFESAHDTRGSESECGPYDHSLLGAGMWLLVRASREEGRGCYMMASRLGNDILFRVLRAINRLLGIPIRVCRIESATIGNSYAAP